LLFTFLTTWKISRVLGLASGFFRVHPSHFFTFFFRPFRFQINLSSAVSPFLIFLQNHCAFFWSTQLMHFAAPALGSGH